MQHTYRCACDRGVDADFIWCFGSSEQCWHSFRAVFPTFHLPAVSWIWKVLGRDTPSWPKLAKGIFHGGHLVLPMFAFPRNEYTCFLFPGSGKILSDDGEIEKTFFFSLLVHAQPLAFALVNCLVSTYRLSSILFPSSFVFPSVQLRRGTDRAAWGVLGIQPRSIQHTM